MMLFSCSWSNDDLQESQFSELITALPFDNVVALSMRIENILRALKERGFETTFNGESIRIAKNDTHCEFITDGLSLRYPLSSAADKEMRVHSTNSKFVDRLMNFSIPLHSNLTKIFIDTLSYDEKLEISAVLCSSQPAETIEDCTKLIHLFNIKQDSARAKSVFQRIKSNLWHYEVAKNLEELQSQKHLSKQNTLEYFTNLYSMLESRHLDKSYVSKIWHRGNRLIAITSVVGLGLLYYPDLITAGFASEIRNFEEIFANIRNNTSLQSKFEAEPIMPNLFKDPSTASAISSSSCNVNIRETETIIEGINVEKLQALIEDYAYNKNLSSDFHTAEKLLNTTPDYFTNLKSDLAKKYGKCPTLKSLKKKVGQKTLVDILHLTLYQRSCTNEAIKDYCKNLLQKLRKTYESKYRISLS